MASYSDEYIIKGSDEASGPIRRIGQSIEGLRSKMMSMASKTFPEFEQRLLLSKIRAANEQPYLDAIKNRGEKLQDLGGAMTTRLTLPIVGAMGVSVRNSMMLERSLIGLEQRWNESAQSVRSFVDEMKKLNGSIPLSIVGFGKLINTLSTYKLKKDDISAALPVIGEAGVATGAEDYDQVGRALIQLNRGAGRDMSRLKFTANQAVRMTQSGSSWEDIEKWGNIGLLRNTQGIKPEEIMAMTEILGEQSKEAMSNVDGFYEGLTEAMSDIEKQLEEAAKKDKKYLVLLDKLGGKDRKINSITEFLQAISDLKLNVAKLIEDDDSKKPIMALLPKLKEYKALVKSYETMDMGFLEQMANRMDEATVTKYQRMIASFVDLSIQMADAGVIDNFREIADSIRNLSVELEKFQPGTTAAIVKALTALALAGPVIYGLGGLMKIFADVYPKLMAAKTAADIARSGTSGAKILAQTAEATTAAQTLANPVLNKPGASRGLKLLRGIGMANWYLGALWAGAELGEMANEWEAEKEASMSPIDKIKRQKAREIESQRWTTNLNESRVTITAEMPPWMKVNSDLNDSRVDLEVIPRDLQVRPL